MDAIDHIMLDLWHDGKLTEDLASKMTGDMLEELKTLHGMDLQIQLQISMAWLRWREVECLLQNTREARKDPDRTFTPDELQLLAENRTTDLCRSVQARLGVRYGAARSLVAKLKRETKREKGI